MIPFMASDPKFDREQGGGDDPPSSTRGLHVMVVEDEPVLARNLARSLERMGHTVECTEDGESAIAHVQAQRPDLLLLDNRLPGISGLETLKQLRAHDPSLLVIMMTAFATLDDAVTAMRLGAADFVRKPIGLAELELAVERVVQNDRLRQELRYYRGQREGRGANGLIGGSEAMQHLRHTVERLRGVQRAKGGGPTILIVGETGTGKGLLARTLHQNGVRKGGPFIEVNCTAIPEALLESELFGYEKGAFTDAHAAKPGLIEAAEGGTLFLDEIGHVSGAATSQAPQGDRGADGAPARERSRSGDRRLGARGDEPRPREGGAERRVPRGSLPPPARPRDRRAAAARACRRRARARRAFRPHARGAVRRRDAAPEPGGARGPQTRYRWPGNVRELANVMERAVLLNDGGAIEPKDLAMLPPEGPASELRVMFPPGGIVWADLEKSLIEQALTQAGGNQVRAAKLLGLSRDALRYRMEKYGLGTRREGEGEDEA